MEDPSGESELEEDSPEANCGKVRWILNKGWRLGKKVLVTGMVISSAPIVLPPLVVISAIGLAVSVPTGVVLASYAFTEKIMSKLLPYGEPPLLLDNDDGTLMSNYEELEQDEERERGTWVGGKRKTDIEKEEGWDWRDRLEGGEMRVEFVDEENDDIIEENAQGNVTEDGDEIVEENGYEEDVDESTDTEEKLILDSIYEAKFEGVDEVCGLVFNVIEGVEQMGVTPVEVTTVAIEESEGQERVSDIVEEEELVEETRGLLEKIRDEGIYECVGMQGFQQMRHANDAKTIYEDVKPTRDIGSVLESKNAENNLEAEKPIGETKNVNNVLVEENSMAETGDLKPVASSIVEDKQKPVIDKEEIVVLQGRRTEDTVNELDFQLIREKENVISSNADAREIADESGLHLFDEKNVSGQQDWHASYETSKGRVGDEGADYAELPVPVSSSARESTDAGISSGKDFTIHSNQVLYDEAKIWAKIDAMRSIVGYKGTPHATCIEELKALYRFTGVEPPTISFSDPPDLAQVNRKLRFLMSIIGVKLDS